MIHGSFMALLHEIYRQLGLTLVFCSLNYFQLLKVTVKTGAHFVPTKK
jgi:hypothetical protein